LSHSSKTAPLPWQVITYEPSLYSTFPMSSLYYASLTRHTRCATYMLHNHAIRWQLTEINSSVVYVP
jgi:hypothetical protein